MSVCITRSLANLSYAPTGKVQDEASNTLAGVWGKKARGNPQEYDGYFLPAALRLARSPKGLS